MEPLFLHHEIFFDLEWIRAIANYSLRRKKKKKYNWIQKSSKIPFAFFFRFHGCQSAELWFEVLFLILFHFMSCGIKGDQSAFLFILLPNYTFLGEQLQILERDLLELFLIHQIDTLLLIIIPFHWTALIEKLIRNIYQFYCSVPKWSKFKFPVYGALNGFGNNYFALFYENAIIFCSLTLFFPSF